MAKIKETSTVERWVLQIIIEFFELAEDVSFNVTEREGSTHVTIILNMEWGEEARCVLTGTDTGFTLGLGTASSRILNYTPTTAEAAEHLSGTLMGLCEEVSSRTTEKVFH